MKTSFSTKFGIRGRLVTTFFGLLFVLVVTFNWLQVTAQEQLLQKELRKRTDLMRQSLIDRGRTLAENLLLQAENDLASYNFSNLYDLLGKTEREDPQLDYILLMTRDGEVRFHTRHPELYGERLENEADRFAMTQTKLAIHDVEADGKQQIEVVVPVTVSTQPWGFLRLGFNLDQLKEEIRTSESEMEAFLKQRLIQSWLTALAFSLIGILLVLLIANNIAKPLIVLTEISDRLAGGDFDAVRAIRGHKRDEVGILSGAFIRMTENLKRSHQELEDHNRTLESKVELRTSELKQMNQELATINQDLETLDEIVKAINREFTFQNLIEALLYQGLRMFPQADRCALIMRPPSESRPLLLAMTGFSEGELATLNPFLPAWLDYFATHSEKLTDGMARLSGEIPPPPPLMSSKIQKVEALLSLRLRLSAKNDGFLILISESDPNAFDRSVIERLVRFREHAVSALSKVHFLEELKDKNEEISKTQQRLIFQAKMASLGTLTAGIAHEIKNPLNFINNFASINAELVDELQPLLARALENNDLRPQIEEQLAVFRSNSELIARHGDRADHIIKAMLRLSREASGEFEYIELNRLLDEYVTLAFHGMRAKEQGLSVVFYREYDPEVGELRVIPEGLGRVFLNIINNACFAVLQDQRIQDADYTPSIWIRTFNRGDAVEIQIADNGMGIPDEIKDRIFTPFFTTKPAGEGTGLGLSITYDIIKREHRGEIRVESKLKEYTRFSILLPRRRLQEIMSIDEVEAEKI